MVREDDLVKVLRELDIDPSALGLLAKRICDMGTAIEFERARESERSPEARAARGKHLKALSSKLKTLSELLQFGDDLYAPMTNILTDDLIGRYLSSYAFLLIAPLEYIKPAEDYKADHIWYEIVTMQDRQSTARQQGTAVLGQVLGIIRERIEDQLKLMRSHKGGNPGIKYRRYAIGKLAEAYYQATGKQATAAAGNLFVRLCREAFEALGIDEDGMEAAIARELRNPGKLPFPTTPQNVD